MLSAPARRIVPVIATTALLTAVLSGPAGAAPPPGSWTNPPVPANGAAFLYGVTAPATGTAWAVGAEQDGTVPLAVRWNGTSWTKDALPANVVPALVDVDAAGPRNAWAIGQGDDPAQVDTLRWNGRKWKARPSPFAQPLDLDLDSRGRPWVVGGGTAQPDGGVQQWKGGTWVRHDPAPGKALLTVAARTPKDVWAGGDDALFRWNGTAWTKVVIPGQWPLMTLQILPLGANDVWVYSLPFDPLFSGPTLHHWNGTAWTEHKPPRPAAPTAAARVAAPSVSDGGFLGRIAPDGAGGLWFQANTSPWYQHFDGTAWTSVARDVPLPGVPYVFDLAQVGNTTEIIGAGYGGALPVIDHFS